MKEDNLADGFNFATADDKRRLMEWVKCPKFRIGNTTERPLLIVGPMASGKTTLAMRLMEYFGEAPTPLLPQGNTVWFTNRREREFFQETETSKIVVIDGLPLVKTKDASWMQIFAPGTLHKMRKPRSFREIETHTVTAHLVVTALAMAKCIEKEMKDPESERYIVVVRLAERRGATVAG